MTLGSAEAVAYRGQTISLFGKQMSVVNFGGISYKIRTPRIFGVGSEPHRPRGGVWGTCHLANSSRASLTPFQLSVVLNWALSCDMLTALSADASRKDAQRGNLLSESVPSSG